MVRAAGLAVVLWFNMITVILLLYVPVNSYGHYGMVSSPNNTFSWASLNKGLTSTS